MVGRGRWLCWCALLSRGILRGHVSSPSSRWTGATANATLFAPTLVGVSLDLALRGRSIVGLSPRGKLGYFASSFIGIGFWLALLYALAWLGTKTGRLTRAGYVAGFAFIVFPLSVVAYGVQSYYVTVFDTYITRDTLRLGVAFHGTVLSWLDAWGVKLLPAVAIGALFTAGLGWSVRHHAPTIRQIRPLVPIAAFAVTTVVFWRDALITTEWLQSPDASFLNAIVGSLKEIVQPRPKQGLTYREAVALPPLVRPAHRPNVLLVLTESVRADMLCSDKTDTCASRYIDDVIPDRIGFRKMTAQSSGTISSCMTLWTGLAPDADIRVAHTTPLVWEVAKALGYRTAYIASQDLRVFGLGPYLANASIDVKVAAEDFGGIEEIHIGAKDERATTRFVEFARGESAPWFGVLHLSNTHYPFRVDPNLEPFAPHDNSPFVRDVNHLRNHIKNADLLQERTLASFYRELRALPSFDDTVTIFISDHGDQLREHGALFHLNNLYDEEIRVPSWVVAGAHALSPEQREALASHRDERVFSQDVNATLLDVMGALDARASFRNGDRIHGRSLIRPTTAYDAIVPISTSSGVWFDDEPVYGVMSSEWKVLGTDTHEWICYDLTRDAEEHHRLDGPSCPSRLMTAAAAHFPNVPRSAAE